MELDKFDCTINIDGRDYKFNHTDIEEDAPLTFIMIVNKDYDLYRDICCDTPFERWTLVKKYIKVTNGISQNTTFSTQVYYGKMIDEVETMKVLLSLVLFEL